ncbi:hypothetical protein IMZ48_30595, partial [Candidatus Bathyarchaeota archaeon]|nr:hypothetical protein [Candidatus Bathyarchaeota archaeon]
QNVNFRSAVRELVFEVKPQPIPANLQIWPLTDNQSLDLNSHTARIVCDSIVALKGCRTLRILDGVPRHLEEDQNRPALSVADVAHLVLSVFSYPRCPPIDTVVIRDSTFWTEPAGPHDARTGTRNFTNMVLSRAFILGWNTTVRDFRYAWTMEQESVGHSAELPSLTMGAQFAPHILFSGILGCLSRRVPTSLTLSHICASSALLAAFIVAHGVSLRSLMLTSIHMSRGAVGWTDFLDDLWNGTSQFPHLERLTLKQLLAPEDHTAMVIRLSEGCYRTGVFFNNMLLNTETMVACGGRFEFLGEPLVWRRGAPLWPDVRYVGPPASMRAAALELARGSSGIEDIPVHRKKFWDYKIRELGDVVRFTEVEFSDEDGFEGILEESGTGGGSIWGSY